MLFSKTFLPILSVSLVGLVKVAYAVTTSVHDDTFFPDAILRITEAKIKQSCVPSKETLLVNGTSPGPKLKFTEGKTVWIRVYNDVHNQNLTMHWHGLTMATAPFSDGTPQAAQWPIPPDHFFDYELHVPIGMAGTYFYHSHVGFQAISVTGPLIVVEQGDPPYRYDGERILHTQDVFPDTDAFIEAALLATPMSYEKAQTMILLNGKGGGLTDDGKVCNESLSVINVEPGKTYRFRLIGGTALSFNSIGIEDHPNLEVIEADASYTERHSTSFMQVGPGQRWSFLVHTHAKPTKQQYYIQLESRDFGGLTRTFAVLNYAPVSNSTVQPEFYPPATPPITLPPTDTCFLDYVLRPLQHSTSYSTPDSIFPTAEEVTRRVNITTFLSIDNGKLTYLINGFTWNEGLVYEPYLVSLYKNQGKGWPNMTNALEHDGLDTSTFAFPALIGEVLEIVIQGTGSAGGGTESHPWHAHGAHYWDLGSGRGTYDRAANEKKWANSPGKPVKRDTTNVYRYNGTAGIGELAAWRAWRLRITQPGVWMIHCHLLPHMVWGMQTAWVMGNSSEVLGLVPEPEVEGYLTYGGSVVGNETYSPEVVEFFPLSDWEDGETGE